MRQGEQLGSCRLLSQAAPLMWRWMPGGSRGTDPATGHRLPWEEAPGVDCR